MNGSAVLLGHYDPSQMLRVVIGLRPPHMAEEEQFLQDLMDPKSPDFHRFLTAEEWNARYAPSAADEERVVGWARAQGFTVTNRYANRLLVDLEAHAGTIEKAFGVTINHYQVGDEVDFSNDRDPLIPAELGDVITAVLGLNNIQRVHTAHPGAESRGPDYSPGPPIAKAGVLQVDGKPGSARSNSASPNLTGLPGLIGLYLDPSDLYSSETYDFGPVRNIVGCCNYDGNGSGPDASIAIAAWNTVDFSDVKMFLQTFGLAGYVTQIYIDGTPAPPSSTEPEFTLDTEWSTAMANSFGSYLDTAQVFVYEGADSNASTMTDMYNFMLSDGYARVMSASYGCAENYTCDYLATKAQDGIFNAMVGQGWTLIAASGDGGATSDCYADTPAHTSVMFPASDPDVLAVGGTTLDLDGFGNWLYEQGWQGSFGSDACAVNLGGSGGGYSVTFGQPGYQHAFGASYRMTPDISLNAHYFPGQAVYFDSKWWGVGGTSIASPEMAAFFAQENVYLHTLGYLCGPKYNELCGPYGQPHNALYSEGIAPAAAHYPFYDMTAGCNSNDQTQAYGLTYYCAGPGYDLVTGWGTANMLQLSWALNWERVATSANGAPYLSFTGPPEGHWYNTDQVISFLVIDYPGEGESPIGTGIAGYAAQWDGIPPSDPVSHPGGGTGDLFYSGPNTYGVAGCLAVGTGSHPHCIVTSEQGCHFAHVHGWNNEGWTTSMTPQGTPQPESYGPVCFDNTPPLTIAKVMAEPTEPLASKRTFDVTLNATDEYSGVAATYFIIAGSDQPPAPGWRQYLGPLRVTTSTSGWASVAFESVDLAGNVESPKAVSF